MSSIDKPKSSSPMQGAIQWTCRKGAVQAKMNNALSGPNQIPRGVSSSDRVIRGGAAYMPAKGPAQKPWTRATSGRGRPLVSAISFIQRRCWTSPRTYR